VAEQRSSRRGESGSGGEDGKLRDYLVTLATDPAELGRFVKDAEAAMDAAALPPEDRAVLRSANPGLIYARLSGRVPGMAPVTVLVVDMEAAAEGGEEAPRIRSGMASTTGGGVPVFPQWQLIFPQQIFPLQIQPLQIQPIFPQQVFPQQIFPLQIQPIFPQQVFPQQIFPLQIQPIFPQQVFPQQIFPQQIFPLQIQPIFPQQIFPLQIQPIFPQQIFPLQIQSVFPQQVFPQVQPLVTPPAGQQG
jgi:hypothetical protein